MKRIVLARGTVSFRQKALTNFRKSSEYFRAFPELGHNGVIIGNSIIDPNFVKSVEEAQMLLNSAKSFSFHTKVWIKNSNPKA